MRVFKSIRPIVYLIGAVFLVWFGIQVPFHFQAVSPYVLEAAGQGTLQAEEVAKELRDSGHVGPFLLFAAGADLELDNDDLERVAELYGKRPVYRLSGGAAPFFEYAVSGLRIEEDSSTLLPLLLSAEARGDLSGFLAESVNVGVMDVLKLREHAGWSFFPPAFTSAGAPLETSILLSAMLMQSDEYHSQTVRDYLPLVRAALAGNRRATQAVEQHLTDILFLSRRLDWLQLAEWVRRMPGLDGLEQSVRHLRKQEDALDTLFAALLLAPDPSETVEYLQEGGEPAFSAVTTAMQYGAGGLESLVRFDRPLYSAPKFVEMLPKAPSHVRIYLSEMTEEQPRDMMYAKALLFLMAGYFGTAGLGYLARSWNLLVYKAKLDPLAHVSRAFVAFAFTMLTWLALEPSILEFQPNETARPHVDLAQIAPFPMLSSQDMPDAPVDQVTLIVLVLFFVLQLFVFIVALLKIREVQRDERRPQVKLQLLDNEENLFDLGLYIGLGGTVASLVLIVMKLVDASLMAAYASTLFGIIFVALLKVVFLRPYRRALILEEADYRASLPNRPRRKRPHGAGSAGGGTETKKD